MDPELFYFFQRFFLFPGAFLQRLYNLIFDSGSDMLSDLCLGFPPGSRSICFWTCFVDGSGFRLIFSGIACDLGFFHVSICSWIGYRMLLENCLIKFFSFCVILFSVVVS